MGSTRRKFSREFKLEAVRMVTERGHSALIITASSTIGTAEIKHLL